MSSVAFHTLGCKLNFSETSTIARQFRDAGWIKKDFNENADVYVINTCSVTENADRECRTIVRKAKNLNPESKVIVIGCYAQLKPQEIADMPGVNLVLGASEKFNIIRYLDNLKEQDSVVMACDISSVEHFEPAFSSDDRTRSFLKVQDGCDYSCSFCTIPMARGRSRSGYVADVLEKIKLLEEKGVQEIILTGVNLGDFGKQDGSDKYGEKFIDLVRALENTGIPRYRISSIEPNLLTDDIIAHVASSSRFMPHFHIPMQSGSDRILKLMRRRYLTPLYESRITEIKSKIPDACIGADVITGFPGETDEDFNITVNFISRLPLSYLHVFTYSERDNTSAVLMKDIVPVSVRRERTRILRNISLIKQEEFYKSQTGKITDVLFESGNSSEIISGYSSNYLKVEIPFDPMLVNQVVPCIISGITPEGTVEIDFLNSLQTA